MIASLSVTTFAAAVKDLAAPVQVVAGVGVLAMVNALGSVSLKPVCVSAKPFALLKVMVSVEATLSPTLAGTNACDIVGATGAVDTAVGQALVPAVVGALLLALLEVTVTVAVSVAPAESVTVSVTVPVALPGRIVTCAEVAPETMLAPPLAVQE
jgi:hypothetical protein